MKCAWSELLAILPPGLKADVDKHGRDTLQELRLRQGQRPHLVTSHGIMRLNVGITQQDISFVVNTASRYSPWSATTVSQGYITARGGHRIGLCGAAVVNNSEMVTIRSATSLCIRVARDFPGIAGEITQLRGSILILGAPGWGKTTLLRDLIRQQSESGCPIAVVDERRELFPLGGAFPAGNCTDILTGCSKAEGVHIVLRTMGPECIAVDEITAEADCSALLEAGRCGVRLLATAHGSSLKDLRNRKIYRDLMEGMLFSHVVIMKRDKSWTVERMDL